jgi:putative membrane protein
MKRFSGHDRFALSLFVLFVLVWTALAIRPWYRSDWLLENMIVFAAVPLLLMIYWHLPLSKISYSLIFVFFCLHEVGAHYTYAEVPYDQWIESLTGRGLNERVGWERNHYDRLIHLFYGLLITYPVREIVLVISTSTIFELLEWAAVIVFGGDLGIAYLGTQGDVWDAQKDMLLAAVGSLIATLVIASINYTLDRNFAREWYESLRVKIREPLGEVAFARLMAKRHKKKKSE